MVSYLRQRKHQLTRPHKSTCNCQRCEGTMVKGQRVRIKQLLDTYCALTSPTYLHQTEHNILAASFAYGRSLSQFIQIQSIGSGIYANEFRQLFVQIQYHACSLIRLVRTEKQIQFLMQSDIEDYDCNSFEYPVSGAFSSSSYLCLSF